eukprot:TRINITY_DN523_c0_g1_i1.p1 TRINITY_DN523_c0_g1~~TRINITY_DN523_c0_g1_i1.p1  ORF type:complete len:288 (+),score=115.18 TRINITY_DN523_c0_g1_i1:52-864(+)
MAAAPQQPKRSYDELRDRFKQLCEKSPDEQQELFLKSFIFALGDDWKLINVLNKTYKKYVADGGESKPDLNVVQAADFLQKNGAERTATQRKQEITDIDLDKNDRISFIEYLLLQYKGMILSEYYKRTGESHNYDLGKNGVGITGVGYQLLDELFTIPTGLDPELERAIEELTAVKRTRENKIKDLQKQASQGGVKGGIASAQLAQMEQEDLMDVAKVEAKINSQMRKSGKESGDKALQKKQEAERKAKEAAAKQSKDALRARIAGMGLQ